MNVDIWEVVIYHTGMYVYALWVGKHRPVRPTYSGAACFNRAYLVSEFLMICISIAYGHHDQAVWRSPADVIHCRVLCICAKHSMSIDKFQLLMLFTQRHASTGEPCFASHARCKKP